MAGGCPTPVKNDGMSNSWDDDIPNTMERNNNIVPNHQPVYIYIYVCIYIYICKYIYIYMYLS